MDDAGWSKEASGTSRTMSGAKEVKDNVLAFVLSHVYGEDDDVTCGQARASKWKKMTRKTTTHLPPDDDTLRHHLIRTNYITYCQVHFNMEENPSPISHGWEIMNGKCRPVRHTLPSRATTSHRSDDTSDKDSDDDSELGESTYSDQE